MCHEAEKIELDTTKVFIMNKKKILVVCICRHAHVCTKGTCLYWYNTTHMIISPSQVQPCPSNTPTTYVERTPNHFVLTFAVLCLCTCCWPALVFAIMGVIYSVQARRLPCIQSFHSSRIPACSSLHL